MTTKLIFLDIDGVLNNDSDEILRLGKGSPLEGAHYCPTLVEKLNKIVSLTGAKIVLSSTWRLGLTLCEVKSMLEEMSIQGEVVGMTENYNNGFVFRGNEIYKWIKDNKDLIGKPYYEYQDYVILDDDSDMLYWQRNNFVQTHGLKGLTNSNVMEAVENAPILDISITLAFDLS